MTIISSKFQINQMVECNGARYKIESKLYCSDLNEWKYYLSNLGGKLPEPISEDKLKEI